MEALWVWFMDISFAFLVRLLHRSLLRSWPRCFLLPVSMFLVFSHLKLMFISGGQYHFVALLAPAKYKNILSWMLGNVSLVV